LVCFGLFDAFDQPSIPGHHVNLLYQEAPPPPKPRSSDFEPSKGSASLVSAGALLWPSEVRLRLPESWVSGSRLCAGIDAGFCSVRVAVWLGLIFSDFQLGCGFPVVLLRGLGWSDFSVATGRTTTGDFTAGDFSGDRSFAGASFFAVFRSESAD